MKTCNGKDSPETYSGTGPAAVSSNDASGESELLNEIYKYISDTLGFDVAREIHRLFKGQQITFPVRLFDPEIIRKKVTAEYDGYNIHQLAVKYGYSEKTIRRILKNNQSRK